MLTFSFTRSFAVCLTAFSIISSALAADPIAAQVKATEAAHQIEAWWGKEVVQADAEMFFGGGKAVDGRFTFEAHGPRARYDRADGVSIIFDGKTAWVTPGAAEAPRGRFHVLTWPWFIMAPFKIQGEGITLSEYSEKVFQGQSYVTFLQTFGSDMGDSPDDWYRFYINPESDQIEAMSYIVTYGKDAENANKQPSIIKYFDYTDVEGPLISTRYEFWFLDAETGETVGDGPKGSGKISNLKYLKSQESFFEVPEGATELKLPQPEGTKAAGPDYTDYARLLATYAEPEGVDYQSWAANADDLKALSDFLDYAGKLDLDALTVPQQTAFYINLYNAAMLQAVFDNYPIDSVTQIGLIPFSIFKKKFIQVGEKKLSLDDVEKGTLLKDYFDPRIHFAVNCASESCPPLRAEPFVAERLEAQLDEQTRLFAKSDRAARIDSEKKRITYSELFKWYKKDFGVENPGEYLNQYLKTPLPLEYKQGWIKYDWALNTAK
ncbi:MAG: DUF6503 family protein [Verrucomicrobiota bacterium]